MSCAEACWRKIGVRFHVTVVTKNVLSKSIPEPYRPAHTKSVILEQKSMARSRMDRFCSKAAASTWKSGSHAEEAVFYGRAALGGRGALYRGRGKAALLCLGERRVWVRGLV